MEKNLLFEYIVFRLDEWKHESGQKSIPAFTKLRLQKILFLICAWNVSTAEQKLLNVFNHFYALPYGPVEMDVYEAMKDNASFQHMHFAGNECIYTSFDQSMFIHVDTKYREYVDSAINSFIADKRSYLTMPIFDLVEITHKWSVWQVSSEYARIQGRNMESMSNEDIIYSTKYYG